MADSLGAIRIICTRPPQQCRQLQCDIQNSTIRFFVRAVTLTLLPCNQPAAVQVILFNTAEAVILNETLNSTTTFSTFAMIVTVDHPTNAIGIGVKCTYTNLGTFSCVTLTCNIHPQVSLLGQQIVVPYTPITLDTSDCPGGKYYTPALTVYNT